jgi:hypothetical protein
VARPLLEAVRVLYNEREAIGLFFLWRKTSKQGELVKHRNY